MDTHTLRTESRTHTPVRREEFNLYLENPNEGEQLNEFFVQASIYTRFSSVKGSGETERERDRERERESERVIHTLTLSTNSIPQYFVQETDMKSRAVDEHHLTRDNNT